MVFKFDINQLSDEFANQVKDYVKFHLDLNQINRKKKEADLLRKQQLEKMSLQEKRFLKLESKANSQLSYSGNQIQLCNSQI